MGASDDDQLDLFNPQVDREKWHPNFLRIAEGASQEERDLLNDWARGFVDRDGKFVKEFQTTFNSSFWEIYLHALFRETGCSRDQSHHRPDFVVTGGPFGDFTAEAVVASNPQQGAPEWTRDPTAPPPPRETILDLACLRLAQAVLAKQSKWQDGYASLEWCQRRPFVVCVAPFDQPWASLQGTEAIDRVLFKGPRPFFSEHDGKAYVVGHTVTDRVFKNSGAEVDLGLFTDERCRAISAVLFSSLATWSKVRAMSAPGDRRLLFFGSRLTPDGLANFVAREGKYDEQLVDGAHLFVNDNADVPIDPQPFSESGFGVHWHQPHGTLTAIPETGLLLSRIANEFRDPSEVQPIHAPPAVVQPHKRAVPPDGVPFAGPTRGPVTDQITLELHKGWTLFVGRDMVDGDWAAIGKEITALSIQEFVAAGMPPEREFMTEFFPTRAEAVVRARSRIDTAG